MIEFVKLVKMTALRSFRCITQYLKNSLPKEKIGKYDTSRTTLNLEYFMAGYPLIGHADDNYAKSID